MSTFPSGTVTFLFTDIEGSTKLAQEHRDTWEALRERHHAILQSAMIQSRGVMFFRSLVMHFASHSTPQAQH